MKLKAVVLSLVSAGLIASGVAWYSGEHPFVSAAGATSVPTQPVPATSPDCRRVVAGFLGACRQVWAGGRQHQRHGD